VVVGDQQVGALPVDGAARVPGQVRDQRDVGHGAVRLHGEAVHADELAVHGRRDEARPPVGQPRRTADGRRRSLLVREQLDLAVAVPCEQVDAVVAGTVGELGHRQPPAVR